MICFLPREIKQNPKPTVFSSSKVYIRQLFPQIIPLLWHFISSEVKIKKFTRASKSSALSTFPFWKGCKLRSPSLSSCTIPVSRIVQNCLSCPADYSKIKAPQAFLPLYSTCLECACCCCMVKKTGGKSLDDRFMIGYFQNTSQVNA